MAPTLTVTDIRLSERRIDFRHPFRFGDVTVTSAPQAFVHVEIEVDGRRSCGATAELMVPKWFDKNPARSIAQTVDELRLSLVIARDLYLDGARRDTAFGHHARAYPRQMQACVAAGLPPLAALYGPAEIDKAIVDALLRALRIGFNEGQVRMVFGIDNRLTPDLGAGELCSFFERWTPQITDISLRHTVGMMDPAASVAEVIRRDGCRYFKIKLCGEPDRDTARLHELAAVLDPPRIDYRATLDANEQYAEPGRLLDLVERLQRDGALAELSRRVLYIEQPLPRDLTWQVPLGAAGQRFAFIIDEADDSYDAFPRALALGYRGISSKSCKGIYKSLLNGARARAHDGAFVAAEDLTCQAGLAVQQDTMLAAFHHCSHVERNGHHYVDGFAGTPVDEARAFLAAHPDLYEDADGTVRLRISDGRLALRSLDVPGFASAVPPQQIGQAMTTPVRTQEYAT